MEIRFDGEGGECPSGRTTPVLATEREQILQIQEQMRWVVLP